MAFSFGQIARRIVGAIAEKRPPLQALELIEGGPNAPHMAQRPIDWREGDIGDDELWYAQVKIDGIRCIYLSGKLYTLQGQPMNCARHALEPLRELEASYGVPMMFDAEYVEHEGFEATVSAFKKGEGNGTIWLFDAVPYAEWLDDKPGAPWRARHEQLMLNHKAIVSPWLGALKGFRLRGEAEVLRHFEVMRAHNHEGVVLKRPDAPYARQRNKDWLRIKGEDYTDMRLIDIHGTDKRGATRLVCRDPAGTRPVMLTTGFASERLLIWENRDLFLGNENTPAILVEVKHNGRTGYGAPRHATFSKLRQDKLAGGVDV